MSDIKGYKTLTDAQLTDINGLKALEKTVLEYLQPLNTGMVISYNVDKRWLSIARTHFEQGFMAAVRSIAQPETVEF